MEFIIYLNMVDYFLNIFDKSFYQFLKILFNHKFIHFSCLRKFNNLILLQLPINSILIFINKSLKLILFALLLITFVSI